MNTLGPTSDTRNPAVAEPNNPHFENDAARVAPRLTAAQVVAIRAAEAGDESPLNALPLHEQALIDHVHLGVESIAVAAGEKAPIGASWQKQTVDPSDYETTLDGANRGLHWTGDVVDVDIDCPEAFELANELPETPAVYGRESNPCSHHLFRAVGAAYAKLIDPDTRKTIIELRAGRGKQSVGPGSTHPSGERVRWDSYGVPTDVDADTLLRIVRRIAAGAVLLMSGIDFDRVTEVLADPATRLRDLQLSPERSAKLREWLGVRKPLARALPSRESLGVTATSEVHELAASDDGRKDQAFRIGNKIGIAAARNGESLASALERAERDVEQALQDGGRDYGPEHLQQCRRGVEKGYAHGLGQMIAPEMLDAMLSTIGWSSVSSAEAAAEASKGTEAGARERKLRQVGGSLAKKKPTTVADEPRAEQRIVESRIMDAFGGQRSEAYTPAEVESFAVQAGVSSEHFDTRWIVQKANTFYVFVDGTYRGPFVQGELFTACEKLLAAAPVELYKGEKQVPKSWQELMRQYGTHAERVEIHLGAEHSRYDSTRNTFVEAAAPLRRLQAEYSLTCEVWLRRLCGDRYAYVVDWLATVTDLTHAAPAVYFHGKKGVGKDAFARGVSRLWALTGPTMLEDAMARFNDAILSCPLVYGNERIPHDNGKPRTEDLRALIANTDQRIERKGIPVTKALGATRQVLGANNEDLLAMRGVDLTPNDIEALADRFIDVPIGDDCPQMTKEEYEHIVLQNGLAKHVLWLRDHHTVQPAPRFACRATSTELIAKMTVSTGIRAALCEHITRAAFEPSRQTNRVTASGASRAQRAVIVKDGSVWVNASALREQADAFGCFHKRGIALETIESGLSPLLTKTTKRFRPAGGKRDDRGPRYKAVKLDVLRLWISQTDVTTISEFDELLKPDAKTDKDFEADEQD